MICMPQRRKKRAAKRAATALPRTPARHDEAPELEGPAAADVEVTRTPDPDGRIPPDHQRDGRAAGRPPEEEVIDEARNDQTPVNPDPASGDLAAEK
jgi:hypothetical protein